MEVNQYYVILQGAAKLNPSLPTTVLFSLITDSQHQQQHRRDNTDPPVCASLTPDVFPDPNLRRGNEAASRAYQKTSRSCENWSWTNRPSEMGFRCGLPRDRHRDRHESTLGTEAHPSSVLQGHQHKTTLDTEVYPCSNPRTQARPGLGLRSDDLRTFIHLSLVGP